MSSHVHIGLYDALREAGTSEQKARIAATDIPAAQNLATKEDLLRAVAGVEVKIADLKADFFRQLWFMAAGIVTLNAAMLTAAVMLTKLFP